MGDDASETPSAQPMGAVRAMAVADRVTRSLGLVIERLAPGEAMARMTVSAAMVNGHALAHGGYIFLLADTAFAYACNTRGATLASAAEIVFVRPVSEGEELVAEARERVRFGRSGVYDVTVRGVGGDVVAEFRGHSRPLRSPAE